jgi:hypothetical protein
MQATMTREPSTYPEAATITRPSKGALWTGRIISGLMILFLVMDSMMKVLLLDFVVEESAKLGVSSNTVFILGIVMLGSTILYAIPRSAAFGALLLTGYLGGAIATHMLNKDEPFKLIFPIILGTLIWVGLLLRDRRIKVLLPW